jgi:hypothetical protein
MAIRLPVAPTTASTDHKTEMAPQARKIQQQSTNSDLTHTVLSVNEFCMKTALIRYFEPIYYRKSPIFRDKIGEKQRLLSPAHRSIGTKRLRRGGSTTSSLFSS